MTLSEVQALQSKLGPIEEGISVKGLSAAAVELLFRLAGSETGTSYPITIRGNTFTATDEFQRPADNNSYLANDAIAAATTDSGTTPLRSLALGRVPGGSGLIIKVRLWTQKVSVTSRVRVHLYSVAQPAVAVVGDNAPMTVMWGNRGQRKGVIDLPAMTSGVTGSDASFAQNITDRVPFVCAAGSSNIYYRLEWLDAVTSPNANQMFFLAVSALQD